MPIERVSLRLALLGGVALWAAGCWAVMLAGGGGRLPRSPPEGVEAPPVPLLAAAPAAPLEPLARYAAISEQPVFARDRRPHPFAASGDAAQAPAELRLAGVLITPTLRLATLATSDGRSLRLREGGESVEGWQLLSLQPRSATLAGPAGTLALELRAGGDAANAADGGKGDEQAPPPAAAEVTTSPQQLQTIRERIQARRKQQQQAAPSPSPSSDK